MLDALEPFHREEAELCAACTFVSDRINAKWTRHAYKLKKWSAKKKLKKALKAEEGRRALQAKEIECKAPAGICISPGPCSPGRAPRGSPWARI